MSSSDSANQRSLDAFGSGESTSTNKNRSRKKKKDRKRQQTSTESPLDKLYTILKETSEENLPQGVHEIPITRPIKPETKLHTTKDIPCDLPALPHEIGQWELAVNNSEHVIYTCSGRAYDYRWGSGGAIYGMEVYLNNRGANKDGKFHRRVQTTIGFENGDQVRKTEINSKDDFYGIRGHNVGENDGDYGYSSGTKIRSETAREALIELLLHLHHNPGPIGRYVETEPDTDWSLHKLSPRVAYWKAPAPDSLGKDELLLGLYDNQIQLRALDPDDSLPDQTTFQIPAIESVPNTLATYDIPRTRFETIPTAVIAANEILSRDPETFINSL